MGAVGARWVKYTRSATICCNRPHDNNNKDGPCPPCEVAVCPRSPPRINVPFGLLQ